MNTLPTKDSLPVSRAFFALLFTILYGLVLAFLMRHHELWFDETEPWLLALYSDSYSALLHNKGFEGHPNLWYSILFVITRFTRALWTLQAAQFCFAVGFVYVFLRYAPFHWFISLLFCFGYYGLFEYGVISRLYALELFTTFLLCTLYPKRFDKWYWYLILLGVNAQTHLFGLFFSGVLGLLLFAEVIDLFKTTPADLKPPKRDIAFGFIIWAITCSFSFWSITHYLTIGPPSIDPYKIQQAATRVWQAFIPIPEFTFHFWNTSLLRTAVEIPLSLVVVGITCLFFLQQKRILLCLLLLFSALFYFFGFKYESYLRHHAHFFIFTLALVWINSHYNSQDAVVSTRNSVKQEPLWRKPLLVLVSMAIVIQFLAGLFANYMDYKYKFFNAKDVASFIEKLPENYTLASTSDAHASTVVAYLEQPIYYLPVGKYSTYFEVDPSLDHHLSPSQLINWATVYATQQKKPVLLISQFKIAVELLPYSAKLLKSFDRNYILPYKLNSYVYLIEPSAFTPNHFMGGNASELNLTPPK